jgi:hypothetical protein
VDVTVALPEVAAFIHAQARFSLDHQSRQTMRRAVTHGGVTSDLLRMLQRYVGPPATPLIIDALRIAASVEST